MRSIRVLDPLPTSYRPLVATLVLDQAVLVLVFDRDRPAGGLRLTTADIAVAH